jgi:purine nucleoside phosphorylase
MAEYYTLEAFQEAVAAIRRHTDLVPQVGIILGSGLNPLAEAVTRAVEIPFGMIPHFPVSTVVGHQGRLLLGDLDGSRGSDAGRAITTKVTHGQVGYGGVMKLLGRNVIVTMPQAASPDYQPASDGIRRYINLIGMAD